MIRVKTLKDKHCIFIKFLASYLIILLIPLSTGFLVYREALRLVEDDARKANLSLLEQSSDIIDRRLDEMESMVGQVSDNSRINKLLYMNDPIQGIDSYKIWDSLRDMSSYIVRNNFITDMYVYCKKSNIILSSSSAYIRLPIYYEQSFKYGNMSYTQWHDEILNSMHRREYLSSTPVNVNGKTINAITYLQSFPLQYYGEKNNGTLMVIIDEKEIHKLLARLNLKDGGWAYIADSKGRIITSYGADMDTIPPANLGGEGTQGFNDFTADGEKLTISYTTSSYNGWTYVAALPYSVVMANADYVKRITINIVLISVLLGIIIAYYLAYRNSRPVKNLVDIVRMLRELIGGESANTGNEYDFLKSTISKLVDSNKHLKYNLEKQKPLLKIGFLNRLLKGELNNEQEMRAALEQIDLGIWNDKFVAVVIRIDGHNGVVSKDILQELSMYMYIIKGTLEDITGRDGIVHNLDNDKIVLLLGFKDEDLNGCMGKTEEIVHLLCSIACSQHNIGISFAAGNIYDNLLDISRSFAEAMHTLEYRVAGEANKIVWYSTLPKEVKIYYYPMDVELRLINLVKAGGMTELEKLLQEIYEENFIKRQLSIDMVWQMVYEIRGTVIKLIDYIGMNSKYNSDEIQAIKNAVNNFKSFESVDEIYGFLTQTTIRICSIICCHKKSHNVKLKEKLLDFLDTNYTRADLCLCTLAEQFGMSEVYLCQFFKEQTGGNFSDYLEQIRINQACELLSFSNLCINDIALRIGYNSDHAFRRAFKKVRGVNPADYRNLSRQPDLIS